MDTKPKPFGSEYLEPMTEAVAGEYGAFATRVSTTYGPTYHNGTQVDNGGTDGHTTDVE